MKKIIELEERWKSYKYRSFIFYIFICVFVVFIAFVGLFIKNQYGKYSNVDNKQIVSKNVLPKENTSTAISMIIKVKMLIQALVLCVERLWWIN